MSWLETLRTGLGAVLSHRLRSGLTMLGRRIDAPGRAMSKHCANVSPPAEAPRGR